MWRTLTGGDGRLSRWREMVMKTKMAEELEVEGDDVLMTTVELAVEI